MKKEKEIKEKIYNDLCNLTLDSWILKIKFLSLCHN